jgi:hypothetical protein
VSLDVGIQYKNPSRPDWSYPFCPQSVLRDYWWPLARKHGLHTLERLECLCIEDQDEAEQMMREFRVLERVLRGQDHGGVPERIAHGMLERLAIALTAFESALAEWDAVKMLYL